MSAQSILDPAQQNVLANIAQFGCSVLRVFDEKGEDLDFAYSVGFSSSLNKPEVLIIGLSLDLMQNMINEIYRQCSEGLSLSDGTIISNLLEGYDCVAKRCTSKAVMEEYLGWALWYQKSALKSEPEEFFQIVWPGAEDRLYPWDEGLDTERLNLQPMLYDGGRA